MRDATRAQLVENWEREDPRLAPEEKETTIRFAKDEDRAVVHTDEAAIGRRILAHPESRVEEVAVLDGGSERVRRLSVEELPDDPEPVGLRASLPVGALSVRSSARKSRQHSLVVSKRVLDELPEPEPVTDGGRYLIPNVGSRVVDRDSDGRDELVVTDTHPDTGADRYEIDAIDATVADVNPEYDPAAPVVEAVYAEEVAERLDGWRSVEDLRDAAAFDAINSYSFPVDRLARPEGGVDE